MKALSIFAMGPSSSREGAPKKILKLDTSDWLKLTKFLEEKSSRKINEFSPNVYLEELRFFYERAKKFFS